MAEPEPSGLTGAGARAGKAGAPPHRAGRRHKGKHPTHHARHAHSGTAAAHTHASTHGGRAASAGTSVTHDPAHRGFRRVGAGEMRYLQADEVVMPDALPGGGAAGDEPHRVCVELDAENCLAVGGSRHQSIIHALCAKGLSVDVLTRAVHSAHTDDAITTAPPSGPSGGGAPPGVLATAPYILLLVRASPEVIRARMRHTEKEQWRRFGNVAGFRFQETADTRARQDREEAAALTAAMKTEVVFQLVTEGAGIRDGATGPAEDAHRLRGEASGAGAGADPSKPVLVRRVFPLHDKRAAQALVVNWIKAVARPTAETTGAFIEEMRTEFGEKVAFYFAYSSEFNVWLAPIAVLGVLVTIVRSTVGVVAYMRLLPFWGLFIAAVWAPSFLKSWDRRAATLQFRWGGSTLFGKQVEYKNPRYWGTPTVDPVTGEWYLHYPSYRRWPKYALINLFLLANILLLVVATALWASVYEALKVQFPHGGLFTLQWFVILCEGICLGLFVDTFQWTVITKVLGNLFTVWENYPTEQQFEKAMIRKLFVFDMCNYFCWFFVMAFVYVQPHLGDMLTNWLNATFFNDPMGCCFGPYKTPAEAAAAAEAAPSVVTTLMSAAGYSFTAASASASASTAAYTHAGAHEAQPAASASSSFSAHPTASAASASFGSGNSTGGGGCLSCPAWYAAQHPGAQCTPCQGPFQFNKDNLDLTLLFLCPVVVTQGINMLLSLVVPALLKCRADYLRRRQLRDEGETEFEAGVRIAIAAERRRSSMGSATGAARASLASLDALDVGGSFGDGGIADGGGGGGGGGAGGGSGSSALRSKGEPLLGGASATASTSTASASASASAADRAAGGGGDALHGHDGARRRYESEQGAMATYEGADAASGAAAVLASARAHLALEDMSVPDRKRAMDRKARSILQEGDGSAYDPYDDYHLLGVFFLFVCAFSVIWPFCPLAVFCFNTVKSRVDGFRLCYTCKRPVPRRATGIGEWRSQFLLEMHFALVLNVAFVCVSIGALEFYVPECVADIRLKYKELSYFLMAPNYECLGYTPRLVVAAVAEHVFLAVVLYIMNEVHSVPVTVRRALELKEVRFKRRLLRALGITYDGSGGGGGGASASGASASGASDARGRGAPGVARSGHGTGNGDGDGDGGNAVSRAKRARGLGAEASRPALSGPMSGAMAMGHSTAAPSGAATATGSPVSAPASGSDRAAAAAADVTLGDATATTRTTAGSATAPLTGFGADSTHARDTESTLF